MAVVVENTLYKGSKNCVEKPPAKKYLSEQAHLSKVSSGDMEEKRTECKPALISCPVPDPCASVILRSTTNCADSSVILV